MGTTSHSEKRLWSSSDMWEVVEEGDYVPVDKTGEMIPKSAWTDSQRQRYLLNSKARNAIMCALTEDEYTKVHSFKSAKQMWDTLALTYEGSTEVKHNKLSLLSRKYELFEMEENESIQAMFGRFQTIVNEHSFLGRTYDNFDHIDKILRSPANNNKLKGKKIYRGPMSSPYKMCIKSFPYMTHSRVQKKMHNTEFLESDAEKYYHQFMHDCTKGASTSGIPIEEKDKILLIKGKSKVRPCSLVHFFDTSIAFTLKNPRPILGPETSIIYLIASVLFNMEAYQKEWKEVTDSWPQAPVDSWCQHISPWKPGDPIPSKEGFDPPSREPSPPPVPESDLQVVASDTPQPMAVMPIVVFEPASTVAAPVPPDFVTRAEFEELKALIQSRLPPPTPPLPPPPPPPPPAADTVSRTEFLVFQNQMSSEFQCLLAFLKQNLPPPPPPPPQE
ncbi:hypothetical protein Fmac_020985 [Flemingia macrophylla]|uniref:Uncharacterized protein n=1 Tax=Flemingia macrophylla TaxID=520843 RepID=A0ABD1LW33_9FABA